MYISKTRNRLVDYLLSRFNLFGLLQDQFASFDYCVVHTSFVVYFHADLSKGYQQVLSNNTMRKNSSEITLF